MTHSNNKDKKLISKYKSLPIELSSVFHTKVEGPDDSVITPNWLVDFSDAYHRMAHSAPAVAQSIIVSDDIAYIALRLSFGGAPNLPSWCCFSEMVTDLSNEIPLCSNWDPSALHSLIQPVSVYKEDVSEPIGQATPLAVSTDNVIGTC